MLLFCLLQEMKARGKTVIVVHHDLNTVPQYFDWVTMVNKQTVAYGPVADTFTDEAIERTPRQGEDCMTIPNPIRRRWYRSRHGVIRPLS